ncbi:hypothetical protein [Paenibacillus cremeus]|uniref:Uncharacterized protein n=1 Tax=Paenibacillus cremeus TaxID=2163881 RepID=A0A559KCK9_9BACL|nr:hypothetical protein [Paenibacillus cremeus]TVY09867.1 hypothetical protein FPZ49_10875 [Paenibacillus cremeus]
MSIESTKANLQKYINSYEKCVANFDQERIEHKHKYELAQQKYEFYCTKLAEFRYLLNELES